MSQNVLNDPRTANLLRSHMESVRCRGQIINNMCSGHFSGVLYSIIHTSMLKSHQNIHDLLDSNTERFEKKISYVAQSRYELMSYRSISMSTVCLAKSARRLNLISCKFNNSLKQNFERKKIDEERKEILIHTLPVFTNGTQILRQYRKRSVRINLQLTSIAKFKIYINCSVLIHI